MNILTDTKLTKVMDSQAAGQTPINSSVIDINGFSQVTFICSLGTMAASAVTCLHIQTGAESDGSDMADQLNTMVCCDTNNDDRLLVVECASVNARYIRVVVTRSGGNSEIDTVLAVANNAVSLPVSQVASEMAAGLLVGGLSAGARGAGQGYGYDHGSTYDYFDVVSQV